MKLKHVLAISAILMISTSSFSQDKLDQVFAGTTAEERAQNQTERMTEHLELTDVQQDKIYTINLRYAREMETAYRASGGKLQRMKRMRAVGQKKDGELKGVLNADQYKKYQQMKDAMRETVKERSKENRR